MFSDEMITNHLVQIYSTHSKFNLLDSGENNGIPPTNNVGRLAVDHPGSKVLRCIHRSSKEKKIGRTGC
tara:strand:+ start:229 stop:435 length:207 start_codon:yes stop_codon:yes gene_type:complete